MMFLKRFREFVKTLASRLWLLRLHRSLVHRLYSTFLWARDIRWLQKKKCIGDTQPITCRPADLLDNELDKLEGEMAQYKKQDEDVLSYALFPQVATEFFKYRQAQETKVDETAADTKNGAYPV